MNTRSKALAWWNTMVSDEKKQELLRKYSEFTGIHRQNHKSLTGREIEEIWSNLKKLM